MFYVLLLVVALVGTAVYLAFVLREVPGAAEQRLGQLEPLPEDIGRWKPDTESTEGLASMEQGLRREVRTIYDEPRGTLRAGRLLKQTRYRSVESNEIVRVDPEQVVKRRRIKRPT
jgi:hypothetical protein